MKLLHKGVVWWKKREGREDGEGLSFMGKHDVTPAGMEQLFAII